MYKIYYIKQNYLKYLMKHNVIKKIISNNIDYYFCSIGIKIADIDYIIPIYIYKNNSKIDPNSTILIEEKEHKISYLLKFNHMVPVINNDQFIYEPTVNTKHAKKLTSLLEYINNKNMIIDIYQKSREIYLQKFCNELEENCNDFRELEVLCYKFALYYNSNKDVLIPKSFYEHNDFSRLSELNDYCNKNKIDRKHRLILFQSESYVVEIIRHKSGSNFLVIEQWDIMNEKVPGSRQRPSIIAFKQIKRFNDILEMIEEYSYLPRNLGRIILQNKYKICVFSKVT